MTNSLVMHAVKAYDFLTIPNDEVSSASALEATRRTLRMGLLASAATIGVFLIGGALAPLESASVLHGSIMPSNYKKTVQHLEGGIIDAILVKDGDEVVEGQPLIRLRKVGALADQGIAASQIFTARVSQARLEAMQNGQDAMTLSEDLKQDAAVNPQFQDILTSQQKLLAADRQAQSDKLAMYNQQIAQLHEDSDGLQARLKSAQVQLGFIEEQLSSERGLVQRGFSTRPRLLALEGQAEDLRGRIGELNAGIGKNNKTEMEINARISNQKSEFQAKIDQELREAQESIAELKNKLLAANDVLDRTVITAPISGIVNDLRYHTVGGVIPSGNPVMDIVPKGGQLLVDADIQPRDISRVHIGQDAKIMFSTYKSRVTPMVMGKVIQVSPDRILPPNAMQDSPMPAAGHYLARVEVAKSDLQKLANPVILTPGMPVEVMVVDGKRSLLNYYLKPFFDSFHRAFREQ